MVGFTKDDAKNMRNIDYLRILGFSKKGQLYLNSIKKKVDVQILSKFKRNISQELELELKSSAIYSLKNNSSSLIEEEYKNHLKGEI